MISCGSDTVDVTSSRAFGKAVTARYPAIKQHILKENGDLRPFVNLFKGEENVNNLQGLQTPLEENDRLLIIPSIAGG